jgi:hypothetical protein
MHFCAERWIVFLGGAWSVFWSFMPRPGVDDKGWYAGLWHVAMYLSLSPGQSSNTILKRNGGF